jgi:hypothetical protein
MVFALLHNFITLVLDVLATVGIAADEKVYGGITSSVYCFMSSTQGECIKSS